MSKYITRRQQKKQHLSNIIKKVLLVVGILAVLEVAFIYFFTYRKKDSKAVAEVTQTTPENATPAPISVKEAPKVKVEQKPKAEARKEFTAVDTVKTANPIAEATTGSYTSLVEPAEIITEPKPVVKNIRKKLSQQKMMEILNQIKLEKTNLNSLSNCVQIRKTNTSNVENAFEIAKFLNTKGYTISGRLTVPQNQKGIHVVVSGSCITLTIGTI
jgi:hypothetical protein